LSQRAQPTSAALERSRAAGTARPLMRSRSPSVWKQNCVLIQARSLAGTYSSQIAGGSTTWLSQSKTGKLFRVVIAGSLVCKMGWNRPRRISLQQKYGGQTEKQEEAEHVGRRRKERAGGDCRVDAESGERERDHGARDAAPHHVEQHCRREHE